MKISNLKKVLALNAVVNRVCERDRSSGGYATEREDRQRVREWGKVLETDYQLYM